MKKMVFLALALVALFSKCSAEESLQQVGGADRLLAGIIDSLVAAEREPWGPGCAIAVIREGEIIFKRGYGVANLDYGVQITPSTVFDVASISKQFTAACILLLESRGMLSLDDDIGKFIPEFPDYGYHITIRHLIHHTSGIRDWVWLMVLAGQPYENVYPPEFLFDLIARQKELVFQPGEQYKYSNSGYYLLAVIVERASGVPLAKFATEEIFKPLGMDNTFIFTDHSQVVKNRALGYTPDDGDGYHLEHYFNPLFIGSSNVHTTVEDLYKWDRNFYNNRVGGEGFTEKMQTCGTLNNGEKILYAFGLEVKEYEGLKTVSHEGDWGGSQSSMVRFPEAGITVISLANSNIFSPKRLAYRIAELCLADSLSPLSRDDTEAKETNTLPIIDLEPDLYEACQGRYKTSRGRVLIIRKSGRKLIARVPGRRRFELLPQSETDFVTANRDSRIVFHRADGGKVASLDWHRGERTVSYTDYEKTPSEGPSPARLAEYEGEFFSDELLATYRVAIRANRLVLISPINSRLMMEHTGITGKDRLHYMGGDKFRFAFMYIEFIRDRRGEISSFRLVHERAGLRIGFSKI